MFVWLPVVLLHPAGLLLPVRPLPPGPPPQQASVQETHRHALLFLGGFQRGQYLVIVGLRRHFNKLPAESPSIILRSQDCPHGRQFYLRKCFDRHQSSD